MKYFFTLLLCIFAVTAFTQKLPPPGPCTQDSIYRQFDFWIGEWEVYNLKGKKAGDSKISIILDSCVILEEWISMPVPNGFVYKGKSFNTYNANTGEWQQTWLDNVGGSTHYVYGKYDSGKIIFQTAPWQYAKDTMAINKLTFFNLGADKVRQLGELSKDDGKTWTTQYDLEYRRKKNK